MWVDQVAAHDMADGLYHAATLFTDFTISQFEAVKQLHIILLVITIGARVCSAARRAGCFCVGSLLLGRVRVSGWVFVCRVRVACRLLACFLLGVLQVMTSGKQAERRQACVPCVGVLVRVARCAWFSAGRAGLVSQPQETHTQTNHHHPPTKTHPPPKQKPTPTTPTPKQA